jgi:hypothetical protein
MFAHVAEGRRAMPAAQQEVTTPDPLNDQVRNVNAYMQRPCTYSGGTLRNMASCAKAHTLQAHEKKLYVLGLLG